MDITEMIVQLLTGTLGSVGFALLFGLRSRYIPFAALGGFLCWGLYLIGMQIWNVIFFAGLLAAAFSAFYSEIMARVKKAPTTLFYITAVIPLIPGRALYYTCSNVVARDWILAKEFAVLTLQYALSIATGACIVWATTITIENIKKNMKAK